MSHASNSGRSDRDVLNSRILIVDDEESNVRLLEYLLHREGYRSVRSTTHPREAVQIYEEFCPDLVLLDLVMPGMDGVEVMKRLYEIEGKTYPSIIVVTANDNDEAKIRTLASGALDFLAKPFNRVEVVERIKKMLNVDPVLRPR